MIASSIITNKQLAGMPSCCSLAHQSIVPVTLLRPRRRNADPVVACGAARQQHAAEHVQRRELLAGLTTVLASLCHASSQVAAAATAGNQDAGEKANTDMRAFRASQLTTGAVVPALSSAQYVAKLRRARPGAADMVESFLDMSDYSGLSTSLVCSACVAWRLASCGW